LMKGHIYVGIAFLGILDKFFKFSLFSQQPHKVGRSDDAIPIL
jgi:hypothetical protein